MLRSPAQTLAQNVLRFAQEHGIQLTSDLKCSIPTHWEKHGDLILLPETAFSHPDWQKQDVCFWQCVAKSLDCSRLAKKFTVSKDGFRTPQVNLLLGSDGWLEQVDNGIRYCYDVTKCMFSAGNISEKLRVASFNCSGETVVDLYAGIGYFTLPYLVHAGACVLHACEWNPDAVEALEKNLILNGVRDRCVIHFGDNRQVCPRGLADRVNLGLIPSSEAGWCIACAALKPSGGILHIHANINSKPGEENSNNVIPSQLNHDRLRKPRTLLPDDASHGDSDMTNCVNLPFDKLQLSPISPDVIENAHTPRPDIPSHDGNSTTSCFYQPSTVAANGTEMSNKKESRPSPSSDSYDNTEYCGMVQHSVDGQETKVAFTMGMTKESPFRPCCSLGSSDSTKVSSIIQPVEGGDQMNVNETGKSSCFSQAVIANNIATNLSVSEISGDPFQDGIQEILLPCPVHPSDPVLAQHPDIVAADGSSEKASRAKQLHCCEETFNGKPSCDHKSAFSPRGSWMQWAREVSDTIRLWLVKTHKKDWTTRILHIEHVKSYAPHVDHIVLDLDCRPR
ncbi:tRNA wybutosine-synthesizing protein 2 homolog isoform X2 [Gigantopelta aegis]|nr:tRNA wybutosine-synthesizing protein 2 homolog isoform X2 [Gigantopelta aegis]